MEQFNRRRFLKSLSAAGALGLPSLPSMTGRPARRVSSAAADDVRSKADRVFTFLLPPEAAFVEAAISRLIPLDELGPGAKEAGVAQFIDRQLASDWGVMGHGYRSGPWWEGTPQQGYQSPLTPQEIYRAAIRETNLYCSKVYGTSFDELVPARQDETLHGLEEGKIGLESVPSRLFFNMLWNNTQEGFFADPVYGGNRDKVGWKLIGFPGVAAAYTDYIEKYRAPYRADPVSIADVQTRGTRVDAHGHPMHTFTPDRRRAS